MSFATTLKTLKENEEDFEWYPTTNQILDCLCADLEENYNYSRESFLDIGAGNGKVIERVRALKKFSTFYAIEKSQQLLGSLNPDIYVLGVDFWQTNLIDKGAGIIFSNPPYSQYEIWSEKIIKEAAAGSTIYLVIPDRWENALKGALENRDAKHEILGSFDFLESEDRKARAHVHLVKISLRNQYRGEDPFSKFFDDTFVYPKPKEREEFKEVEDNELVKGRSLPEKLILLYQRRMGQLQENYAAVCMLDYELLIEFGMSRQNLIESLRLKIANLKKEFWGRLFEGMEEIKKKMTKKSRNLLLTRLNNNTGIEFSADNIYAVVIWAIKNANAYFDDQIVDVFERMISKANVINYKSNQRVFDRDSFFYNKTASHYCLGHRIVIEGRSMGLDRTYSGKPNGIKDCAADFLSDLITLANNLGFQADWITHSDWNDSGERLFYCDNKGKKVVIFSVRCFQNQNMHLKFLPDFIHALNIAHGKIKGWVSSGKQAAEEMDIPVNKAKDFFNSDFKITVNNIKLLS